MMAGRKELLVFASIRRELVLGKWHPDARLRPAELATRLGVSEVPIRHALIRLAERGLVANARSSGFVVAHPETFATEVYCDMLAWFYADSIERVTKAGRVAHAAAELHAAMGTTDRNSAADGFLEASAAFRRVLLLAPYQGVAERLDDTIALHAAFTVASQHFYKDRLRELSNFAEAFPNLTATRLRRAVQLYFTRFARGISRTSARMAGVPLYLDQALGHAQKSHPAGASLQRPSCPAPRPAGS